MTEPTDPNPDGPHDAVHDHRQHQAGGTDHPPDAAEVTPPEEHGGGHDMHEEPTGAHDVHEEHAGAHD